MKITKRGTPKEERLWKGICRNCESEVEATESELSHIIHSQREGSSSWEKCIVCGAGAERGYGGLLFYPAPRS